MDLEPSDPSAPLTDPASFPVASRSLSDSFKAFSRSSSENLDSASRCFRIRVYVASFSFSLERVEPYNWAGATSDTSPRLRYIAHRSAAGAEFTTSNGKWACNASYRASSNSTPAPTKPSRSALAANTASLLTYFTSSVLGWLGGSAGAAATALLSILAHSVSIVFAYSGTSSLPLSILSSPICFFITAAMWRLYSGLAKQKSTLCVWALPILLPSSSHKAHGG